VSFLERPSQQGHGRRRRLFPRLAVLAVALLVAFVTGMAFGQALDDGPEPGGTTTSVRTLSPLPQQPPARTVTVTITQP
jgi:hypothetical protein